MPDSAGSPPPSPPPPADSGPSPAARDLGFLKLSAPAAGGYWEVPVLYLDEHLMAIDKPAGLLTSPDRYDPDRPNLMRLLHSHVARGIPWAKERQLAYLSNAHRLDFETSGILLLARTKPVLVKLADEFGANTPKKTYLALTDGSPAEDEWEINAKLSPYPNRPGVMRVDPKHGKHSRTAFKALIRFLGWTWVECSPHTGRTHQIRVHLQWSKLPITGDRAYGGKELLLSLLKREFRLRQDRPERPLISRVALHAAALEFTHPVTGLPVRITSPVPRDLRVAIKYLGRYALPAGESVGSLGPSEPDSGPDNPAS